MLDFKLPWNGISPRYLTKGSRILRLAPEGTGRPMVEANVPGQLELFPEGTSFNGS